jgi:hypothetical protein
MLKNTFVIGSTIDLVSNSKISKEINESEILEMIEDELLEVMKEAYKHHT